MRDWTGSSGHLRKGEVWSDQRERERERERERKDKNMIKNVVGPNGRERSVLRT